MHIVLTLLLTAFALPASAANCTTEDAKTASFWRNYYQPQEAYDFGRLIQRLVKNKDLSGIFENINGELINGPRRSFIKGKSFDDIFPQKWQDSVLSDEPRCSPLGWRGFELGSGLIWFNKSDQKWAIFSINGATVEEPTAKSTNWIYEKKLLREACFSVPSISGDNFDEIADAFGIENKDLFFNSPGLFYGRQIKSFDPITPSWCKSNQECKEISILSSLSSCSKEVSNVHISDDAESYAVISEVPLAACNALAPNVEEACKQSFLLEVSEDSGGSMGSVVTVGIFAIFDFERLGLSVVPLKYFSNTNEALNFIDRL